MMALVGPAVGGAVFGLMMSVYCILLLAQRGLEQSLVSALLFLVLLPPASSLFAFFLPSVWYMVAVVALYVVPRVGMTGRMTWAESVILAVVSVVTCGKGYKDHLSEAMYVFLIPALCGAVAVRYLAARWAYIR